MNLQISSTVGIGDKHGLELSAIGWYQENTGYHEKGNLLATTFCTPLISVTAETTTLVSVFCRCLATSRTDKPHFFQLKNGRENLKTNKEN